MRSLSPYIAALLAGCVPTPERVPEVPAQAARAFVPKGATIEPSGFARIMRAPPVPYPEEPPPAENKPTSEAGYYAADLGTSEEEAAQRLRDQAALRPEFERLLGTLRRQEAGNFTAVRMVHKPDWAYVFYFKRDPERTLARYTPNPRFKAALARYTRAELEALIQPWIKRFQGRGLTSGWGVDDTYGRAEIMIDVTEEEFREIAARESWHPVPDAIELSFVAPLAYPPVAEAARPFVRIFPQNSRGGGIQLLALGYGRMILRDGCLFVKGVGGRESLAYFHRETGLGFDEERYLALIDRKTGETRGRIGEWFSSGGPNQISEDMPMVAELRARCGTAPILNFGNPESAHKFRIRAWQIDELARRKRISRERAWEMLKSCWARNDARRPDQPPSGECNL